MFNLVKASSVFLCAALFRWIKIYSELAVSNCYAQWLLSLYLVGAACAQ